jgi:outer membrane protein
MKRFTFLWQGALAIACVALFAQCNPSANTSNTTQTSIADSSNKQVLKIAYVETDTLLSKYSFSRDITESMIKKEEDIRATLNEKTRNLQKEAANFQRKLNNNAFATRARAEQENKRLVKKQKDLQELSNRLSNELAAENQKNSLELQDSIRTFLKEYSKLHGYDLILSNSGLDNILYANDAINITKDIVKELNKRYSPNSVKKDKK